jgi:hypothetical protein
LLRFNSCWSPSSAAASSSSARKHQHALLVDPQLLRHQNAALAAASARAPGLWRIRIRFGNARKSPCNSVRDFARFGKRKPLRTRRSGGPGRAVLVPPFQ